MYISRDSGASFDYPVAYCTLEKQIKILKNE